MRENEQQRQRIYEFAERWLADPLTAPPRLKAAYWVTADVCRCAHCNRHARPELIGVWIQRSGRLALYYALCGRCARRIPNSRFRKQLVQRVETTVEEIVQTG